MEAILAVALVVGIIGYFALTGTSVSQVFKMGKLSPNEIAMYAYNAGFSGDDLVTAVAIALAESGGDPNAEGDNGTSYGLWQIHFTVHPEFDASQLKDPAYNASAAYSLYLRRHGFNDWSTYTVEGPDGVLPYAKFLDAASGAVNA